MRIFICVHKHVWPTGLLENIPTAPTHVSMAQMRCTDAPLGNRDRLREKERERERKREKKREVARDTEVCVRSERQTEGVKRGRIHYLAAWHGRYNASLVL